VSEHPDETTRTGSDDLRLPANLREPFLAHLNDLHQSYLRRGWAGRVGFGAKPALLVIDLARFWLDASQQIGSRLAPVVENVCRILAGARAANVPIFFTTYAHDPAEPPSPHDRKLKLTLPADAGSLFELDPRHEMLTALGVDTLIVTGISTSHCVYATCRDATDSFRVVVPREAVGERCELMHHVFLLDIDIDLGDVVETEQVLQYLQGPR
jgi:maleamate amidohydrolase